MACRPPIGFDTNIKLTGDEIIILILEPPGAFFHNPYSSKKNATRSNLEEFITFSH